MELLLHSHPSLQLFPGLAIRMSSPRMTFRGAPDQGKQSQGSFERESHHGRTHSAKAHDAEAGQLRHNGMSVSGCTLVKHDSGSSTTNDRFWSVVVRGEQVLMSWGKMNTQGKSEVRDFPDALLAERWASESALAKMTQGCVRKRVSHFADSSTEKH